MGALVAGLQSLGISLTTAEPDLHRLLSQINPSVRR
jgi:hypothetical protein